MRAEMDEKVFIYPQIWHFSFVKVMIQVLFAIGTFTWRVNNYVAREGKVQIGETKVLLL